MKRYKLKRNNWTLYILPVSLGVLGLLILTGFVLGPSYVVPSNIPDFKP